MVAGAGEEDYLYPESHFAEIVLPKSIRKAVLAAG